MSNSTQIESSGTETPSGGAAAGAAFVTTHWSVVMAAGRRDPLAARAALETLCGIYWRPLYAYVRRRGHSPEDAQDLTQGFFTVLLERNRVTCADPARGRFRNFLLASMNHFLADEWDKARAAKRGGGKLVPIDLQTAEEQLADTTSEHLSPDRLFERRWAITVLEQVYQRLREEYGSEGRERIFASLRGTLAGDRATAPYGQLAKELGMSEGAIKVAAHRLRRRYRELLRHTIAETVAKPEDVEDEMRYLLRTVAG